MRGMSIKGVMVCVALCLLSIVKADLKLGFYDNTCPKAEKIVSDYVEKRVSKAPALAAPLLRLHFHDCFVRGCDASILINSTSKNQAEKSSPPNLTIQGYSFIDGAKNAVESECPGVVSCADIVALVARDATVVAGGPYWNVPTGRRDGLISISSEALSDIPRPTFNFSALQSSFASKGLSVTDLLLLSGAHTIGVSHCNSFTNRLYNFTGKGDQDPALDKLYAPHLKSRCKSLQDNTTIAEMDPGSFKTFDLSYFKLLLKRRGLFQSDAALTTDSATKSSILKLVNSPLEVFFKEFSFSMEKMARIEVKTGYAGEIRKHCAVVNS